MNQERRHDYEVLCSWFGGFIFGVLFCTVRLVATINNSGKGEQFWQCVSDTGIFPEIFNNTTGWNRTDL